MWLVYGRIRQSVLPLSLALVRVMILTIVQRLPLMDVYHGLLIPKCRCERHSDVCCEQAYLDKRRGRRQRCRLGLRGSLNSDRSSSWDHLTSLANYPAIYAARPSKGDALYLAAKQTFQSLSWESRQANIAVVHITSLVHGKSTTDAIASPVGGIWVYLAANIPWDPIFTTSTFVGS